jgi:hypothetical protein
MDQYKAKQVTGTTVPRVAQVSIELPHGETPPAVNVVVEMVTTLDDGRVLYEGIGRIGIDAAPDQVLYELDPDSRSPTGRKMSMGEFLNWAASFGVTQFARRVDAVEVAKTLPEKDSRVEAKPMPAEAKAALVENISADHLSRDIAGGL